MSHRGKCQLAESSDPSHPDPTPIPDTVGSCIVSSWLVAILGVDAGACGGPHSAVCRFCIWTAELLPEFHQCREHHAYLDACLHYTGLQGLRKQRDLQPESNMRVVRLVCLCVWRVMLPQDPGYSQGADARLERKVMHTAPLQPEPSSSGQRVRAHCFACVAR